MVRKTHTETFNQFARRDRTKAGDHTITGDALGVLRRLRDKIQGLATLIGPLHLHGFGPETAFHAAVVNRRIDQIRVALFDAWKLFMAVDQNDMVVFSQCQCVLDAGVTRANHDDGLALILVGVVELVLHAVEILTGHAKLADVALQTDTQYDVLGEHQLARRGL